MTRLAVGLMSLSLLASACSHASQTTWEASPMLSANDIRMVAPALDKYRADRLLGEVWKRAGLSSRDRSIVTLAALIARDLTAEMPYQFNLALDHGVTPRGSGSRNPEKFGPMMPSARYDSSSQRDRLAAY
jgi:4-carboxymuconolactone decarboxylase